VYRMGQIRNVLVYHLLCEHTVDEAVLRMLETKQQEFDAFADESAMAEIQTYLLSPDDAEVRVRQRGKDGSYLFYRTEKRRVSETARVEVERRITQREYLACLMEANPARHPVRKTRYCLTENNRYYEIDLYPEWHKQAVLELELREETEDVVFPEGIRIRRRSAGS
ncbi:MAG: hypothetical protein IJH77_00460, partial [Mogibacterium sp.]|nr:hypothetical protein [Mogibacterium sp.]